MTFSLLDGSKLYIRYNDFGEYSYQLDFSQKKDDRIRYDNFDDKWPVSSQPHHFHPRNGLEALESPMTGDPEHDMPLLIKVIVEEDL